MKIEKVATDLRGKHHFMFDNQQVYIFDFPSQESLGARYDAANMIVAELWKALEEEKKKAEELKKGKENVEKKDDKKESKIEAIKPEIIEADKKV